MFNVKEKGNQDNNFKIERDFPPWIYVEIPQLGTSNMWNKTFPKLDVYFKRTFYRTL